MIRSKKSLHYLFGMNVIHMGTNYLWISFESYILPLELIIYHQNSLFLGLIAFIGTSAGVFIGLLSGTSSDKYNILWGKRGPYILIGAILAIAAIDDINYNYIKTGKKYFIENIFSTKIIAGTVDNVCYIKSL